MTRLGSPRLCLSSFFLCDFEKLTTHIACSNRSKRSTAPLSATSRFHLTRGKTSKRSQDPYGLVQTGHNGETFPLLETRPMNGGPCLAIRRLIRGSAVTKAAAISVPWSWLEVSTKALTLDDVSAVCSVTR